jgi:hypothetical protein
MEGKMNARAITTGLSLMLLTSSAAWSAEKDCYVLTSGRKFCEPLRIKNAQLLIIIGKGDYSSVAQEVSRFGLTPQATDDSGSKAFVWLEMVRYLDSDIGKYDEFIVAYPVKNEHAQNGLPADGNFSSRLILDSRDSGTLDYAIAIGREIYGYPKVAGKLIYEFEKNNLKWRVRADAFPELEGSLRTYGHQVKGEEPAHIAIAGTENRSTPCWTNVQQQWRSTGDIDWNPHEDRLTISGDSPLKKLHFEPIAWEFAPSLKFTLTTIGPRCGP